MNRQQMNELLIRIDERTRNIEKLQQEAIITDGRLYKKIRHLEHWRTGLMGGWTALAAWAGFHSKNLGG